MVAALFYWYSERALNVHREGGRCLARRTCIQEMSQQNVIVLGFIFVGNSCGSDADKRVPIVFMNSNGMSAN